MHVFARALTTAVLGAVMGASPSLAAQPKLGASFGDVRREYAAAQLIETSAVGRVLRLRDIDYAGLRWESADFSFDGAQRLKEVTLRTKAVSYDVLLAMASRDTGGSGYVATSTQEPSDADMQIRVCEQADGYVSLTYEPRRSAV